MNNMMLGFVALGLWEIVIILLVLLVMGGLAVGAVVLVVWLTRRGTANPPVTPPRRQAAQSTGVLGKRGARKFSFVEEREGKLRIRWGVCLLSLLGATLAAAAAVQLFLAVGGWRNERVWLPALVAGVGSVCAWVIFEFSQARKARSVQKASGEGVQAVGSPPAGESTAPAACPRCGTPLPGDAPQGLCPRCVLGVGLATHTEATGDSGPHGTKVLQPPPAPAEIAKHFPQLEILECLGRGGMGVVYQARQPKLNRLVALKILAPEKGADPKFAERFLREAQALARLSHPNIVTVHDFGEAEGLYYLLMEYVDGMTLRQLLQAQKVAPEEALGIVPKICDALQFAHEQGVVHRDIKPENVLLDRQGRVKIADFGIAKIVAAGQGRQTITQDQVVGTPHYMAPEQVERPQLVDHRADIYSLGVVFYEMLTGELPLGKFQPPSKKVQVDVRLDEVVLHALEKEPERRYQHASEVKTAVETIAAAPGAPATVARAGGGPVRILRWRDAWPWNWEYIQLWLFVPMVLVGVAIPVCWRWCGAHALWLLFLVAGGIASAAVYAAVGRRVGRKQAAALRIGGEVAQCLMFRRPFQSPGVAVLREDRLELLPIVGQPIIVPFADITAVKEVRWFNGTRLWSKKGFVMDLATGQRVGVAVAEVFARRWRVKLSRGTLPEIPANSGMDRSLRAGAAARPASGFSRAALWGAGWLLICVVAQVWSYTPPGWAFNQALRGVFGEFLVDGVKALFVVVGFAAPVGVTVLGWVATTEIRRSGGRMRGLGLASGEMVLFPLLALDAWLLWLCSQTGLKLVIGAAAALAADALLIYWVWRWVRRPLAAAESKPVRPDDNLAATVPLASQLWRVGRRAALVAALSLLLLETLLQLEVGWRESTGELWTMALYSACLAAMVWAAWPLRRQPWTVLLRAGAAFALFAAASLASGFYSLHLRPNLGLYREPDWVAQHPAFQREWRQRIEKNLWREPVVGPTEATTFGPVTERVLYSVATQRPIKAEELDSGREIEVPAELEKAGEGQFFHWLAAQGADLLAFGHKRSWELWVSPKLASVPTAMWDQPVAADLLVALKSGPVGLERAEPDTKESFISYRLGTNAVFPLTFAFGTRAGGFGVIQVMGFAESPRGVKIRYKLGPPNWPAADALQPSLESAASEGNPDVLRVRLQQAEAELARLTKLSATGRVPASEVEASQDNVALLKAELAGDPVRVARLKLAAAERKFRRASGLWEAGRIPALDYEAAKADVEARHAVLQATLSEQPGATFGPVIERVLNDPDDRPREETILLATGALSSELTGAEKEGGGRVRRLVASPGDMYAEFDDYVGGRWGLITAGLELSDLSPRQWETATVSEARKALQTPTVVPHVKHYGATLYLLPEGLSPMTFAFRTRQGLSGILQVTGFTDNPRGVKIRYKLVVVAGERNPSSAR